jgi:putative lysine transport system permease protein
MIKKILLGIPWVIAKIYVTIFRGTPMIVQAMVIYYGSSTVFGIDLKPFNAAIFIILLNTGAYMSETVRGGINSIDVGQIEGAKALGMGYVPMMIYIILPQTFKIIAPQIGNTFVANIKDTSVLNVIAVTELFYITKVAAGTYFRMFEAYTITALIYLTLTLLFNGLLKLIEKYMAGKESYEVLNPAAAK